LGDNGFGQAAPPSGNDFVAIAAYHWHSLALKADGSIIGWSDNSYCQADPPSGNNFVAIAAGGLHSLAIKEEKLQAKMEFTPKTLNCDSSGNWLKAHFVLPEEISPQDVDANEPAVANPMGIKSEHITILGSDNGPAMLEVVFDREAFCAAVADTNNSDLDVIVTGSLMTGQHFYGADTISVIGCHR
jgi:hypothetical protein